MIFWKETSVIKSKDGVVHFKRFCYFSCKLFSLYKHIILQPDSDIHEHDHPWDFVSIVLEGSYKEMHKGILQKKRTPFSIQFNKAEHLHKLFSVSGKRDRCITFVITGSRKKEWGYLTSKGWVDNKTYRQLKRSGELI